MSRIADAKLPADMAAVMQNNLHRTLYNNPPMAENFCVIAKGVHYSSNVPHRIRELAILRIAATLGAEVEWAQHLRVAEHVGVTTDEARAVRDGLLDRFAPNEKAAILFAEAVDQCRVTDIIWQNAKQHFSEVALLDLVMVSGFYGYASRVTMAMGVEVDAGLTGIAES